MIRRRNLTFNYPTYQGEGMKKRIRRRNRRKREKQRKRRGGRGRKGIEEDKNGMEGNGMEGKARKEVS
jgi:hypothetical protein